MMPLAVLTAGVMLAGWFPFSALWHQQHELDATAAQLRAVQRQEQSLQAQARVIDTKEAAVQLAREQYQLVAPGQSLIQVLPGVATGGATTDAGDPGLQPLVSPSTAAPLAASSGSSSPRRSTNGFVSRLVHTLEFWR